MGFLKKKLLIEILKNYTPILKREKIIDKILGGMQGFTLFGQQLPPGVTPEEAIEVVATSSWALGLAKGICTKLMGYSPETTPEEYNRCVYNVSHIVAARLLGLEWRPPTKR